MAAGLVLEEIEKGCLHSFVAHPPMLTIFGVYIGLKQRFRG